MLHGFLAPIFQVFNQKDVLAKLAMYTQKPNNIAIHRYILSKSLFFLGQIRHNYRQLLCRHNGRNFPCAGMYWGCTASSRGRWIERAFLLKGLSGPHISLIFLDTFIISIPRSVGGFYSKVSCFESLWVRRHAKYFRRMVVEPNCSIG